MLIYPAIDIKNGRCVRLTQGLINEEKKYFDEPLEAALLWMSQGAKVLHVVDLDGAFEGSPKNLSIIKSIIDEVDIPVQVGGGIRSLEAIEALLGAGAARAILGTKALEDKEMLKEAIKRYGDKIVVSIDAKGGYVATEGWVKTSELTVIDFVKELEAIGVDTIVYTDIARDGMLMGPDIEGLLAIKKTTTIKVIASGGISCKEDLERLKEIGVEGAIVGKALYEGKLTLTEISQDEGTFRLSS